MERDGRDPKEHLITMWKKEKSVEEFEGEVRFVLCSRWWSHFVDNMQKGGNIDLIRRVDNSLITTQLGGFFFLKPTLTPELDFHGITSKLFFAIFNYFGVEDGPRDVVPRTIKLVDGDYILDLYPSSVTMPFKQLQETIQQFQDDYERRRERIRHETKRLDESMKEFVGAMCGMMVQSFIPDDAAEAFNSSRAQSPTTNDLNSQWEKMVIDQSADDEPDWKRRERLCNQPIRSDTSLKGCIEEVALEEEEAEVEETKEGGVEKKKEEDGVEKKKEQLYKEEGELLGEDGHPLTHDSVVTCYDRRMNKYIDWYRMRATTLEMSILWSVVKKHPLLWKEYVDVESKKKKRVGKEQKTQEWNLVCEELNQSPEETLRDRLASILRGVKNVKYNKSNALFNFLGDLRVNSQHVKDVLGVNSEED